MQSSKKLSILLALLASTALLSGCDLIRATGQGVNDTATGVGKAVTGVVSGTGEVIESAGKTTAKAVTPKKSRVKAKHHHHKKHHSA